MSLWLKMGTQLQHYKAEAQPNSLMWQLNAGIALPLGLPFSGENALIGGVKLRQARCHPWRVTLFDSESKFACADLLSDCLNLPAIACPESGTC